MRRRESCAREKCPSSQQCSTIPDDDETHTHVSSANLTKQLTYSLRQRSAATRDACALFRFYLESLDLKANFNKNIIYSIFRKTIFNSEHVSFLEQKMKQTIKLKKLKGQKIQRLNQFVYRLKTNIRAKCKVYSRMCQAMKHFTLFLYFKISIRPS